MGMKKDPRCNDCELNLDRTCTGFMQPEGKGSRRLMVMAEALGEHEERDGLPLRPYAQAGAVVARALRQLRLERDELLISNMVWGRPKNNKLEGTKYEQIAIDNCYKYNRELLNRTRPRAILATGNIPLRHLTGYAGKSKSIMSVRGYVLPSLPEYYLDGKPIPVIPTIHPSFIARGGDWAFGVFMHDMVKALRVASGELIISRDYELEPPVGQKTNYIERPTVEQVRALLERLRQDPTPMLSTDIETDYSRKKDDETELDGRDTTKIVQIQFSLEPGSGIAIPWRAPYLEAILEILGMEHDKIGHNWYEFDYLKLRREGTRVRGKQWDSRWMFHHAQPDLPANLQWASSFYGFPHPWKHMIGSHFEYYGICDVDAVQRIWVKLPGEMRARGIWDSFVEMVTGLKPILRGMTDLGIGISVERREELRGEIQEEKEQADVELQHVVPDALKPRDPKSGYVSWPKEAKEIWQKYSGLKSVPKKDYWSMLSEADRIKMRRDITEKTGLQWMHVDDSPLSDIRPVKIEPFLPNSTQHVQALIKHYGEAIPKNLDGADTTGKDELGKLIKKLLNATVKSKMEKRRELAHLLNRVLEYRALNKIESTYIDGWPLGDDGRFHSEFGFAPSTGQLSSSPNAQNAPKHGELAKRWRRTIVAREGCSLVEFDYKSFHALTLGFEARCPAYMRLARLDCHSYLAWQMLKLDGGDYLLELSDEELLDKFKWFKSDPARKFVRDKKAKPTILGYGFGLGAQKMFDMNSESFRNKKECQYAIDTLDRSFPELPLYRRETREKAMRQGYLLSRYGFIRYFWGVAKWDTKNRVWVMGGEDSEAAIAFLPANDAFGKMREAMLDLSLLPATQCGVVRVTDMLINTVHDSLIFEIPDPALEWAISTIYHAMTRPARKLVDPEICPEGLVCDVEIAAGKDWGSMKEVRI